jgi:hypothetical protein
VGVFDSFPPARDQLEHGSSLTIVWFQENFALPIDKTVLDSIQAIDWNAVAWDWSY